MRVLASAVLVGALAVAGCGGGDDDNGGGAQPPAANQTQTATAEGTTTTGAGTEDAGPQAADDEAQRSHPKGRSLAEYVQRADRICRRAQVTIAARSGEYRDLTKALAQGKLDRPEYIRRSGALTERSGEVAQRAVVDLKELPRPAARRDAIDAYLKGATAQSQILTAQGKALRQGQATEVGKLNVRAAQARDETKRAARRVGFRICGGG